MKKLTCFLMALIMCLTMVPAVAFAGTTYDEFGPTEDLPYLIEFHWNNRGNVTVDSSYDQMTDENNTKVRTTASSITFELHPDEENSIDAICVEQEGGPDNPGNEDGFVNLESDERYDAGEGTFTISLEGDNYDDPEVQGLKFVNINFDFTDNAPGGSANLTPGQYIMRYADSGSVEDVAPDSIQNFTTGEVITWNMVYPAGVDTLRRVDINELVESGAHYEYNDGDEEHNSDCIVVDNTAKTISFTPDSDNPFEVCICWTEEDVFNGFGYNDRDEFQIHTNVTGAGSVSFAPESDRGWTGYEVYVEDHTEKYGKYNFAVSNTSVVITFTPDPDENLDLLMIGETEYSSEGENLLSSLLDGDVYTYTVMAESLKEAIPDTDPVEYRYKDLYIEAHFSGQADPGEPGPDDPAGHTGLDALKDALEGYVFAYYGADADAVKTFMAKELSERRIGDGNAIGREDFAFGEIFGLTSADIKDCLEFKEATTSGTAIDDISYYPYTLSVADADPETDGDQPFEVEGCVYILNTDRDIVFAAHHDEETEYSIITIPNEEFATVYAYASEGYDVYGNAVMLNGIDSQDENIQAAHLTQEHAGLGQGEDTFPIGCRLVVSNNLHAVTLGYTKDAAAWAFANSNAYVPGEDPTTVRADVFCGSDEITFSTMRYGNEDESLKITGLEVLNLSANAVSVSGKKLTFHTDYDYAQVKITYDDSTSRYLNIYRVGLVMNGTSTSGTTDKSYVVWHGTDQSVLYDAEPSAEKVVTATFYYGMEGEIDNHGGNDETAWGLFDADVASSHAAINHVNLFVTISYSDGRTVRKIVDASDAITREANAVATENGGSDKDLGCTCGYAGQGSCHLYDDFILWSGSESDFMKIEKITAIVYTGDENTFGGVKVGSGAGVAWENK